MRETARLPEFECGDPISIDVGEEARRLNGVLSCASPSELHVEESGNDGWMKSDAIPLTIMSDMDGNAGSENSENSGIMEAGGIY